MKQPTRTFRPFEAAIRAWRENNNYTIQQSAAYLGVPMRTLQEWLAGREPRVERQQVIIEKMGSFLTARLIIACCKKSQ